MHASFSDRSANGTARVRLWSVAVVLWLATMVVEGRPRVEQPIETQTQTTTTPESSPPEDVEASDQPPPIDLDSYDSGGRRDPFVSLLRGNTDFRVAVERPGGLSGLSINEISLRGLVLTGGVYLAVMEAPDRKTYILRGDEELFDGVVKSVSADGVTFLQDVRDPLSLVSEREVVRTFGREEAR